MRITEMHTVRQEHRPLRLYLVSGEDHSRCLSSPFSSQALLLLYDITSKSSFDNIRVNNMSTAWKHVDSCAVRRKLAFNKNN